MTLRLKILTLTGSERFVTEDCIHCGTLFAMVESHYDQRQSDKQSFYCPRCGKSMVYNGKTDAQKLKDAQARETALKDQLTAAVHEAEQTRQALLRDRQRFANGVCPCCNRSFENVRRHMASQHPDYDAAQLHTDRGVRFRCSCGREFESMRGLRTHQGHVRPDDWAQRAQSEVDWKRWGAHTTVVGSSR